MRTPRATTMPTLLPLVRACQNDDPWADPTLHALRVDGVQIGFVPQCVLDAVREFLATEHGTSVLRVVDDAVSFANGASCAQRSEDMARLTAWMRDTRRFPDPLDGTPTPDAGWRNEAYAVYGPGADGARSAVVFTLERAACGLFGIATFGVHVTVRTRSTHTGLHAGPPHLGAAPLTHKADVAGLPGQLGRRRDYGGRRAARHRRARVPGRGGAACRARRALPQGACPR